MCHGGGAHSVLRKYAALWKIPSHPYATVRGGAPGRRRPLQEILVANDRPPYPQVLREVQAIGFSATGRRYGVSDNAVRKWLRAYERDQEKGDAVA
jgi:hypothetical protein